MRTVFADTGYWIALLNPKDQWHIKAREVSQRLGPVLIITTEMVLAEVLNMISGSDPRLREAAVNLVAALRGNPNTRVVPQSSEQFASALQLYAERKDKTWSLTDCASFLTMQRENITDALAHDQHFEQAGNKALLR